MPTNLLRGYLQLPGTPFSSVGFFYKTRKGNSKCKKIYCLYIREFESSIIWLGCKLNKLLTKKVDTFFWIWVFEVVCLVKLWENCSGVKEIRVCEVAVVDSVGVVDGEGIC